MDGSSGGGLLRNNSSILSNGSSSVLSADGSADAVEAQAAATAVGGSSQKKELAVFSIKQKKENVSSPENDAYWMEVQEKRDAVTIAKKANEDAKKKKGKKQTLQEKNTKVTTSKALRNAQNRLNAILTEKNKAKFIKSTIKKRKELAVALDTAAKNAEDTEYTTQIEQETAHLKKTDGGTKAISHAELEAMTPANRSKGLKDAMVAQRSETMTTTIKLILSLDLGRRLKKAMKDHNVDAITALGDSVADLEYGRTTNTQCYKFAGIIDKHDAERFLKMCDKSCHWSFLRDRLGVLDAAMTNFERMDVFKSSKKQVDDEEEQGK